MSRFEDRARIGHNGGPPLDERLLLPSLRRRTMRPHRMVGFGAAPKGVNWTPAAGITREGHNSVSATSITLPAHIANDIIIIGAARLNSTPASLPAGWTNIHSSGANSLSIRLGWRLATSSAMTSGTWTNAGRLVAIIYRGAHTTSPIGNTYSGGTALAGTSGSADTGAITLTAAGNWFINALVVSVANSWGADVSSAPALTDYTVINGSDLFAMYDSERSASDPGQSNFYVSSGWRTFGFELKAA